MVKEEDDSGHLQTPLLSEGSFTFPASSPWPHVLDLDSGERDSVFAYRARGIEGIPETEKSCYFESFPRHSNHNRPQDADEEPPTPIAQEKAKTRRSKTKRELRNPIQKKSFVKRAAHTATHDPAYFFKNLIWGIVLWPKWAWDAIRSQKTLTILSLKTGVAAGLASVICVINFPQPYTQLSTIAIWAVITIDILAEANIGLSLSKGVNRVAGTFSAGALAVILTQVGPDIPSSIYPYYVVFWVTLGGFVFRFLKGIPPLKEQWGYAFTVATIAFHILLISSYQKPELVTLPIMRFCMILLGFFLASVVNLAFQPVYAGDTLHKLVAKNFDTAADVLSRCVTEYSNSRMLDHVPDILSGRSEDDKIHQSYHEIVMSDSDVDKLLNAVSWEPCHGPFFKGYPWHRYDDITDYLRYTLYDVIALDSCLRASIQAPKHLRDIFAQDMNVIAAECSDVLHTLAYSMRNMCKFSPDDILRKAEEAALSLQNKIYIHTPLLLGRGVIESPRYSLYAALSPRSFGTLSDTGTGNVQLNSSQVGSHDGAPRNSLQQFHQSRETETGPGTMPEKKLRFDSMESGDGDPKSREHSAAEQIRYKQDASISSDQKKDNVDVTIIECSNREGDFDQALTLTPGQPGVASPSSQSGHREDQTSIEQSKTVLAVDGQILSVNPHQQVEAEVSQQIRNNIARLQVAKGAGWKQSFMKRRDSLGHDWEGTLDRISALSLVKFASLLIEVVAKLKFVVTSVDELSQAARFKEIHSDVA